MPIKRSIDRDIAVLTVATDFMAGAERAELRNLVQDLIEDGIKKVILDLSGVRSINSTGIGSIVACYVMLNRKGGELRLAGVNDRVRDCLHISMLDTVFELFPDVPSAAASLEES